VKLFRILLNAMLIVFVVDAGAAFVDELIHLITDWHILSFVRLPTNLIMTLSTPFIWLAIVVSPRVPKSVFGPILVFLTWVICGAMPMPIYLGLTSFGFGLAVIELLVAGAVVARMWQLNNGKGFLVTEEHLNEGPFFSATNAAGITAATLFLGPPALAIYSFVSIDLACKVYSADFVGINLSGFEVAHKQYTKGDKTIDLIGMAHLGDQRVYDTMFDGIEANDRTILLEEGVADSEGHLGSGPLYDKMAERVGLSTQKSMKTMTDLEVRNADVDVKEFHPDTLKLLGLVLEIYRADDPLPPLMAYISFAQGMEDPEAMGDMVYNDLIVLRNDILDEHIDKALLDHDRIVVPWGAYHMKDVEPRVLEKGFTEVSDVRHTLVPFKLLLGG